VFKEFVIDSIGELFIYPSIICSLYGFINEKGWELHSTIAKFDLALLIYAIVTDMVYTKLNYIFLLIRVIRISYKAQEEDGTVKVDCVVKYFSPLSLAIPYAFAVIIIHWLMLAIIGIRIYVDNFTTVKSVFRNFENESSSGNYKSSPMTRYMIFCGAYLPLAATVGYTVINDKWILKTLKSVQNYGSLFISGNKSDLYRDLLHKDRRFLAYVVVIFVIGPFIPFAVGGFLPDYKSQNFELNDDVRSTAVGLGLAYLFFFYPIFLMFVLITAFITYMLVLSFVNIVAR